MFLVSDGTTGVPARMILVEREEDVEGACRTLMAEAGIDAEQIVVNPVGPPVAPPTSIV